MKKLILTSLCLLFFGVVILAPTAQAGPDPTVVWHDPQLNWDFINITGVNVNDLDIWVDNPNYDPTAVPGFPTNWWAMPFNTLTVSNGDHDGDGDQDTLLHYTGGVVNAGMRGHGGLDLSLNGGSGKVLDAYWTLNGNKVGNSTAITYEKTRVVNDPELYMELSIAKGFFTDPNNYGHEAGWTHIRTFANIPSEYLNLADINSSLDLNTKMFPNGKYLTEYEVYPKRGGPQGTQILYSDVTLMNNPDSFFDVFLDIIPPEKANKNYEALLVADVLMSSDPVALGTFWNLNPQSPEPATLSLLVLGGLAVIRRRRS